MSADQRETAFLRQCLGYDDTDQRHALEKQLVKAHRDELCVRRAIWLMALSTALAVAGLCYSTVFLATIPPSLSRFASQGITQVLCAFCVASLICLLAFCGLGIIYRRGVEHRRDECRQLAMKLLESRLGKRREWLFSGTLKAGEDTGGGNESALRRSEKVKPPDPIFKTSPSANCAG